MVRKMRFDWSSWFLPRFNHVFVKLAVSFFLFGVAFRLFILNSIFSPISETTFPVKNQTLAPTPEIDRTVAPEITVPFKTPGPVATQEINRVAPGTPIPINSPAPVPTQGINTTVVTETVKTPVSVSTPEIDTAPTPKFGDHRPSSQGKCDLLTGEWIPNPSGPIYTNETCQFIEDDQNCMKNGRPDSGYLYWRWKPRDCELPPFNAVKFLELMRHKSWALIGDSIARNYVQSMLCTLSKVDIAVQVYHDKEYKSRRWHFPSYNFTLSVIWSPFLVRADTFVNNDGVAAGETQLYLDKLDKKWVDQYQSFDYMIISGGYWILRSAIYHENNTIVGCHQCPGKNLTEKGFEYAYHKALQLVLNFIITSNHKGLVLFRTTSPEHFENGEWYSGGTCNRTGPYKEGEIDMEELNVLLRNIELEEFEKAVAALGYDKKLKLKLMDVAPLSLLRPDGHPGPYRNPHPFADGKKAKVVNDCLHWCLPGPIDAWNDVLMELVVNN